MSICLARLVPSPMPTDAEGVRNWPHPSPGAAGKLDEVANLSVVVEDVLRSRLRRGDLHHERHSSWMAVPLIDLPRPPGRWCSVTTGKPTPGARLTGRTSKVERAPGVVVSTACRPWWPHARPVGDRHSGLGDADAEQLLEHDHDGRRAGRRSDLIWPWKTRRAPPPPMPLGHNPIQGATAHTRVRMGRSSFSAAGRPDAAWTARALPPRESPLRRRSTRTYSPGVRPHAPCRGHRVAHVAPR